MAGAPQPAFNASSPALVVASDMSRVTWSPRFSTTASVDSSLAGAAAFAAPAATGTTATAHRTVIRIRRTLIPAPSVPSALCEAFARRLATPNRRIAQLLLVPRDHREAPPAGTPRVRRMERAHPGVDLYIDR